MCLYDKLISKIVLVIISIRVITYKCNLKHYYFHSKKTKQKQKKQKAYEQFVRLHTST